jgi:hypothetical protein
LPDTQITLHSLDQNTDRTVQTDGVGNYSIENVLAGRYGPRSEPGILSTLSSAQNTWAVFETEWLSHRHAVRAEEVGSPSSLFQVCGASRFIRKQELKLWKRVRKRQIAALQKVHHFAPCPYDPFYTAAFSTKMPCRS